MPIIERKTVQRRVQMGELFDEMGCLSTLDPTDDDGDTICDIRQFGVKVQTLDWHRDMSRSWHNIEAIRWTKPENTLRVIALIEDAEFNTVDEVRLECADKHRVYAARHKGKFEWLYVDELDETYEVMTQKGIARVVEVSKTDHKPERLCDMQVENVHAYLSNDILSHNSHGLVQFGAQAILAGHNVNHYTFELSEPAIGLRYDSHLTGIPSNEISMHKDEVLHLEDNMRLGKLIIKGYPTGTATIQTLRAHVERTTLQGHKPDLIIIDYADIMRSTRKYDAPRFELKLIYEELRNLATDFDIPIWTASQSNRQAATSDIVGLESMSEAYGKAMVADIVLSLSRKPEEKASGLGRLFVAKNRAGRDGIIFPVKINTATSTISVLEGADSLSLLETQQKDDQELRNILRNKWAEVKRDKQIPTIPLRKPELLVDDSGLELEGGAE